VSAVTDVGGRTAHTEPSSSANFRGDSRAEQESGTTDGNRRFVNTLPKHFCFIVSVFERLCFQPFPSMANSHLCFLEPDEFGGIRKRRSNLRAAIERMDAGCGPVMLPMSPDPWASGAFSFSF
jgi:hypothetical protein